MDDHWKLEDINWDRFDATKVDPGLLAAVKAASVVESNANDYVAYLASVFSDSPAIKASIIRWGQEEEQHGAVLAKWAELADPDFCFAESFERFREIYQIPDEEGGSVRGSPAGEMIARCVVESGTSSFYTAIRDATDEPVMKEIAQRLAADEFRHYKLFYDTLQNLEHTPSFFERAKVAIARVSEADDDELASAFYVTNTKPGDGVKYDRRKFAAAYEAHALALYKRQHIGRLVAMIAKAVGIAPHGRFMRIMEPIVWKMWRRRARRAQLLAA